MFDTIFTLLASSRGWNMLLLALASLFVYAIVSNLLARRAISTRVGALETGGGLPKTTMGVLFEFARFGFYVGVPFMALYLGWIDLRAMGLGVVDWAEGLRWAIVILLAAWLVLTALWLPYLRATNDVYAAPRTQGSFARRMVELIYMQAHWAFYRAAAIVFLTDVIREEVYWGAVVGFGLVMLEAFTNPRVRTQLTQLGQADGVVWNFGMAILNTLAFIVTRNFYLLALIHFLLELTVPHLRPTRDPRAPAPPLSARPREAK